MTVITTPGGKIMPGQDIKVTLDGQVAAADAAIYLGLKDKTLAMQRTYGGGPPFLKLGRIWYFKQDLDDWIKARRVTTTAELYYAKQRTGALSKRAAKKSQVPRARVSRRTRRRQRT
jgi:hypothetical protein